MADDLIRRSDAIKAIEELPNAYNGWSDTYDKAYIIGTLEEVPRAEQTEPKSEIGNSNLKSETQNSNLTFEKRTMRDCYNCKRYESEEECVECKYEPQTEPSDVDCGWK